MNAMFATDILYLSTAFVLLKHLYNLCFAVFGLFHLNILKLNFFCRLIIFPIFGEGYKCSVYLVVLNGKIPVMGKENDERKIHLLHNFINGNSFYMGATLYRTISRV